jgi:membrane associated rhomboid family serine protease
MIPIRTTAPVPGSPTATMALIVVNVSVFFYHLGLASRQATEFIYTFALVPAVYSHPELARQTGLDPQNFAPFITNTFLHGGGLHLIINMWTLWLFGGAVEERLGHWRFVGFYLCAGPVGSLSHLAFNLNSGIPALGASGTIAGTLGAYTLMYPKARVALVQPIFIFPLILHLPAVAFAVIWFAVQVYQGRSGLGANAGDGGGISWWAHIGGFLAGLALAWLFTRGGPTWTPPRAGGPHGGPHDGPSASDGSDTRHPWR